ncbi:HTH-type transcriptional regulator BetI [Paraconexibacter sp. AEG42_29]|uniref:HTH-type transcriptional regulator BetI n=1 Tax=Paraconexibacter sp. AEG42_29 TaxID=2997339 RepID=A0AAU7B266_9ACTN
MAEPAHDLGTRPRRTQAERRATTRAALLDAALVSLVEDGYGSITTRGIAERAGVSQGTQQHYFATKADLVVEAMRHATEQIAHDVGQRVRLSAVADPAQHEAFLEELWRVHQSLAFRAALELWIAARTDDELRRHMRGLERDIGTLLRRTAAPVLPDLEQRTQVLELLDVALAAIRGFATLAPVVPAATLERRWAIARPHLAAVLRAHTETPA